MAHRGRFEDYRTQEPIRRLLAQRRTVTGNSPNKLPDFKNRRLRIGFV